MTLTLLALLLLPTSLMAVINPKEMHLAVKNMSQTPESRLLMGLFVTLLGFFVFAFSTHLFDFEWVHLMTWIGAVIILKGAIISLFPGFTAKIVKKWNKVEWMPIFGFVRLLFILALIYIDTQVIAS